MKLSKICQGSFRGFMQDEEEKLFDNFFVVDFDFKSEKKACSYPSQIQ